MWVFPIVPGIRIVITWSILISYIRQKKCSNLFETWIIQYVSTYYSKRPNIPFGTNIIKECFRWAVWLCSFVNLCRSWLRVVTWSRMSEKSEVSYLKQSTFLCNYLLQCRWYRNDSSSKYLFLKINLIEYLWSHFVIQ